MRSSHGYPCGSPNHPGEIVMSRLVVVLLLAGCVCFQASAARDDDARAKAVALVEKLEGKLMRFVKDEKPNLKLSFTSNKKVTDADLKEFAAITDLTELTLRYTKVTDAGAKHIAALKGLRYL